MKFTKRRLSVKFLLIFLPLLMITSILHSNLDIKDYAHSNKQIKNSKCETIHIGFEHIGYKPSLNLHTMLKSLLFHRRNPLYFHIIVDDISEKTFKILFETWSLPQVRVTFYNVRKYEWYKGKNPHFSKISKLAFPTITLTHITKIIVVDTDLLFTSDVSELWNIFQAFNVEQVIGMSGIEGQYYLSNTENSVILYNLKKLKEKGWNNLWFKNIDKILSNLVKVTNGNVTNLIVAANLSMIYRLPCQWTVQTNINLTGKYTCSNNKIQVINLDTSEKFNVKEMDEYYGTFLKYDGYLLRRDLGDCGGISQNTILKVPFDECSSFREAETRLWRTLLYFRKFEYNPAKCDVTLVSQLSYDRLKVFEELSKKWNGPMSLTFYVTDSELLRCLDYIENSELLQKRLNIAYHVVFKEGTNYPINELRNVALRNVVTSHVFLTDIDFLPVVHSYIRIKQHINRMKDMERKALIVPAFQTIHEIPSTKQELFQLFRHKTVLPFRWETYPPSHSHTNYKKWLMIKEPYKIRWGLEYEPYIVVQSNVTEFDRRFIGFGWNKVSHIMELYLQGYEFVVLPNVFIVHKRHGISHDKMKFQNNTSHYMCLQKLIEKFVQELMKKYRYNGKSI